MDEWLQTRNHLRDPLNPFHPVMSLPARAQDRDSGHAPRRDTFTVHQPHRPSMAKMHEYRSRLLWTGAEQGPTRSYEAYSREYVVAIDGKPALRGSSDPMFRGDAALHNPEDLLVAALSSCHLLSYLAHAARAGVHVVAYEDDASGTMRFEGGGGHFTEVVLRPRVTIAAGSDEALAERLHDRAHHDCFIASSMNFPVRHEATTVVEAPAA
jgi:organic hydroperoxide reductase OsmC/OhrA